jgi:hypothetical protein
MGRCSLPSVESPTSSSTRDDRLTRNSGRRVDSCLRRPCSAHSLLASSPFLARDRQAPSESTEQGIDFSLVGVPLKREDAAPQQPRQGA